MKCALLRVHGALLCTRVHVATRHCEVANCDSHDRTRTATGAPWRVCAMGGGAACVRSIISALARLECKFGFAHWLRCFVTDDGKTRAQAPGFVYARTTKQPAPALGSPLSRTSTAAAQFTKLVTWWQFYGADSGCPRERARAVVLRQRKDAAMMPKSAFSVPVNRQSGHLGL